MPHAQNSQAPLSAVQSRPQVREQVLASIRQERAVAQQATSGVPAPAQAPTAPVAVPPIPAGGGRVIIDQQGDRTVITSAALPPELMPMARMAQETALGLMGLIAAMVILGPFARMLARRFERRNEIKAGAEQSQLMQRQMEQLQQSLDSMSLELERIGEAQRFQSKLLYERKEPLHSDR